MDVVEPIPNNRVVVEYTPYYSKEEFIDVYNCLYSTSAFARERGIRRITVWECRAQPALPLGISATSSIVNALLKEDAFRSTHTPCFANQEDFRLMYAAAITRFVNLVCEMYYLCVPGERNVSHRRAAKKLNIPEWVINLRHEATHRKMPSVKLLRSAAIFAELWLKKNYWEPEINSFKDYVYQERFSRADIESSISVYLHLRYEELLHNLSPKKLKTAKSKILGVWKTMKNQILDNHNVFFEALIAPGAFMLTLADLENVLGAEDAYITDDTQPLPDIVIELWTPMILMICNLNLFQEFFEALLDSQNQPLELHQRMVFDWCSYFTETDMIYRTELQDVPEDQRRDFIWIKLLAACMRHPNKRTAHLLTKIMNNITSLGNNTKGLFTSLVSIFTGLTLTGVRVVGSFSFKPATSEMMPSSSEPSASETMPSSLKTLYPPSKRGKHTEEDFKRVLKKWKKLDKKSVIEVADEDIDWSSAPLGEIFNPINTLRDSGPMFECVAEANTSLPVVDDQAKGDVKMEVHDQVCQIKEVYTAQRCFQ